MFIQNFAHRAHHLSKLTRKEAPFEYGPKQIAAQEDLKVALLDSPTLHPIDYTIGTPVILAVDTSYITIGFILSQCDLENLKKGTSHDLGPSRSMRERPGSLNLNSNSTDYIEHYGAYSFNSSVFAI